MESSVETKTNPNAPATPPLLDIKGLQVGFRTHRGTAMALDGLNLHIEQGETLCVVGESGCGKSVTAMSILRLIPSPGQIMGGEILFEGRDLISMSEPDIRKVRGNRISMIFQEPMTSLNPVLTIGTQMIETLMLHENLGKKEALDRAEEMLVEVKMPNPRRHLQEYAHQLSGGMRQRVMIAMALSCRPQLLIADEPTTALDVTIQAQILDLIHELKDKYQTAVMFITHDLGVVAEIADRVAVMYAGEKVAEAPVHDIFKNPRHPYTHGLIKAIPMPDQKMDENTRLYNIPGTVPHLLDMPKGCRFATRCERAQEQCFEQHPPRRYEGEREYTCFNPHS